METVKLQKYVAECGLMSRRAAEKEIENGNFAVNGVTATLGMRIDPNNDAVTYKGKSVVKESERKVYIMLNKPKGVVTTMSDEKGRKSVADIVDAGVRVYPVGRLDMDSEGLLLMTNDGEFANRLMHPKHEVEKTYLTWVSDYSPAALERLKQPIELDGYRIRAPKVKPVKPGLLEITIHEGRNRQVRRMCEAAGMHVTRLKRIREGCLLLGDLPLGTWRYLTPKEVEELAKTE